MTSIQSPAQTIIPSSHMTASSRTAVIIKMANRPAGTVARTDRSAGSAPAGHRTLPWSPEPLGADCTAHTGRRPPGRRAYTLDNSDGNRTVPNSSVVVIDSGQRTGRVKRGFGHLRGNDVLLATKLGSGP